VVRPSAAISRNPESRQKRRVALSPSEGWGRLWVRPRFDGSACSRPAAPGPRRSASQSANRARLLAVWSWVQPYSRQRASLGRHAAAAGTWGSFNGEWEQVAQDAREPLTLTGICFSQEAPDVAERRLDARNSVQQHLFGRHCVSLSDLRKTKHSFNSHALTPIKISVPVPRIWTPGNTPRSL
jgi:hypothetical protein